MAHKLVLTFFLNQLTGRYYLPIALYLAQISLVLIEFEATAAFRGHIAGMFVLGLQITNYEGFSLCSLEHRRRTVCGPCACCRRMRMPLTYAFQSA